MLKKWFAAGAALLLSVGLLSACGSGGSTGKKSANGYVPKKLRVQFVPSQNANTLEAKAKPLEKLLGKRLGIPVTVSVSTTYNSIIEAMDSKKVDVGFLPPSAYVIAHKKGAADVLLQALRYGVNLKNGQQTNKLVDHYYAIIIAKKDSNINSLKDLKGKKIAWQDVTSSAGYVWPAVEMMEHGINPQTDVQGLTVKGHDQAVIAVLNGQVDAAPIFGDARDIVKKDYPNVFKKTKVVYTTKPIPNDTVSVRPDMSPKWKKKIAQAFIDIGNDPKGKKIIESIYSHEGYTKSKDSNFDIVRTYQKKLNSLGQ